VVYVPFAWGRGAVAVRWPLLLSGEEVLLEKGGFPLAWG
jgi:hypothetical protein